MPKRILIVQSHPDAGGGHFGDALAEHYANGARAGEHEIEWLTLNRLGFPLLASATQWREGPVPESIESAQAAITRCDHLAFFYPLWMGDMPALLKGFLEQVLRPEFNLDASAGAARSRKLAGRSARLVVTMGMPAMLYRGFYRAHSVRSFRRNILHFVGIRPVRTSLVGLVEGAAARRDRWLARMESLGAAAR
jgi:putative NADPH-quinone reductase